MPLLEVRNVTKTFRTRGLLAGLPGMKKADAVQALSGVSLSLDRGDAMGIVGESGAGKTTLASLIIGLERPTSGEVLFDGSRLSASSDRKKMARKAQLVWQDTLAALDPRQKIGAAIAQPLLIHKLANRSEAYERSMGLMREVGLDDSVFNRYPHEISGGQAQRVVIARALALEPGFMIYDEPASALDIQVKVQIAELLMRLRSERGLTYLVIAHDLPLVRRMTSSLAVMYRGRIVEQGPTRLILQQPAHPYTQLLVGSEPKPGADFLSAAAVSPTGNQAPQAAGCPFSHRCPLVIDGCLRGVVTLSDAAGRQVACHRGDVHSPT
ncbi:MAG: ABC transporter ATP-binding protein [Thermoleophilia bacterium]